MSDCRLGSSVKYDPLAFLQTSFRTTISDRWIYNGLGKDLWSDTPIHAIWRFISWHLLVSVSHPTDPTQSVDYDLTMYIHLCLLCEVHTNLH